MTQAVETIVSEQMPTDKEMRHARRRGLIEGIFERHDLDLDTFGDSEAIDALVVASADVEPEKARALVAALTSDDDVIDAVSGALLTELRSFEADLRELTPSDSDAPAADVVEPAASADASVGAEPPEDVAPAAAPTQTESPDLPVHKVLCMATGCKAGATYRSTASGAGFFVLERYGMDMETALGVGPNGRPLCPADGHGEMTLADEQLPIEQAIAQVNERVAREAKPPRLPFPSPPFNYEGALHHIVEKRHEVARLEEKHEDLKGRTKKAKDELDEANEQLGKVIEDYEERERERQFEIKRRQRQAEEGHPEGTTLVRCTWEQAHQDDPCPFCVGGMSPGERNTLVRILGSEVLPRDASGHADQVVEYRTRLDVQETIDALEGVVHGIHAATIAEWTPEARAAVRGWVTAYTSEATPTPDRLQLPAGIGRAHSAAAVDEGAKVQTCSVCGSVIKQLDSIAEAYPTGALVRLDCAGEEAEPHRYPDTAKKKPARAREPKTPARSAAPPKKPAKKKAKQ